MSLYIQKPKKDGRKRGARRPRNPVIYNSLNDVLAALQRYEDKAIAEHDAVQADAVQNLGRVQA